MSEHEPVDNVHTRAIAKFVSSLTIDRIPAEVRTRIKLMTLDSLGCALYGVNLPWSRIMRERLAMIEGGGQRIDPGQGDQSPRGLATGDTAEGRRTGDRAPRLRTDRGQAHAGGDRGCRAAGRTARGAVEVPGILHRHGPACGAPERRSGRNRNEEHCGQTGAHDG